MYATTYCSFRVSSSIFDDAFHKLTSKFNKAKALSNSLYAFRLLTRFCLSKNVIKEYVILTLAVILMFSKHKVDSIKLASLCSLRDTCCSSNFEEQYYQRLFECFNQCITLSCCDEDIIFLLCDELFELNVFCNLIETYLYDVKKTIEFVKNDTKVFARLMMKLNSKVFSFWLATIWTSQTSRFTNSALKSMSSISLSMTSWIEVRQFFIEVDYQSISNREKYISRAREFNVIYLVHFDAVIFFTSSSFFEKIAITNISLDIKRHLLHDHKSLKSNTYWILETKQLISAQKQSASTNRFIVRLSTISRAFNDDSSHVKWVRYCEARKSWLIL